MDGGYIYGNYKKYFRKYMMVYVDHKKTMMDMENDHGDEEGLYKDADYNFHKRMLRNGRKLDEGNRC